jgi:hypothetical protein
MAGAPSTTRQRACGSRADKVSAVSRAGRGAYSPRRIGAGTARPA